MHKRVEQAIDILCTGGYFMQGTRKDRAMLFHPDIAGPVLGIRIQAFNKLLEMDFLDKHYECCYKANTKCYMYYELMK